MPTQTEYLRFQIEGGTRTPKGTIISVPSSNVKLNRYVTLAGGQGRIKRLLVAYESSTQYRPSFDFYGIGERSVRTNIGKEMDKAIARALQSVT
jgi:hypothetical protein